MKKKEKLISRNYRITKEQDAKIKRMAKKQKLGEAEIIRDLIDHALWTSTK